MAFLGIDIGTSGCKAVVFNDRWEIIANSYKEYRLINIGERDIELDPEDIWQNTRQAIREVNARLSKDKITALSVSAIGDVIIPLDRKMLPIRPSIVDFDIRGRQEIASFANDFGVQKFFEISGMPPLFIGSLAKILYLKDKEPANYERIAHWATYEDYILYKLGIGPYVSQSLAARTMLFDIRKKKWSKEILESIDIDCSSLPETVASATILGKISDKTAEDLEFEKKVTVCSGGHDMVCAALAAGLSTKTPQTAIDINGTIEGIIIALQEANTNQIMLENNYPCYPGYKGYVSFSVNLTSGCVIKWHMDILAKDLSEKAFRQGLDPFEEIRKGIDPAALSNLIFIPHFSGSGNPSFNTEAKGCIYGMHLNTSRQDIIKGLYEGLCFEIKIQLDAYQQAGVYIDKLISVGKGAKSDKWLQLKANITGKEVVSLGVLEASSMGAAALAATANQVINDPLDAVQILKNVPKTFFPDQDISDAVSEKYKIFKRFFDTLDDFEQ